MQDSHEELVMSESEEEALNDKDDKEHKDDKDDKDDNKYIQEALSQSDRSPDAMGPD